MKATTGKKFLQGIPICEGVISGHLVMRLETNRGKSSPVSVAAPDTEWKKYNHAKTQALHQINTLSQEVRLRQPTDKPNDSAEVFDCFNAFINDDLLVAKIRNLVFEHELDASTAITQAFKDVRDVLLSMRSIHIKEKAFDLDACEDLLQSELCGSVKHSLKTSSRLEGKIVAIEHPSPQEIIQFHKAGVAGIIAECGSNLSHAAILARSFNIPTVFCAKGLIDAATQNSLVLLDATSGQVSLNPTRSELRKAEARKAVALMLQQKLKAGAQSVARTSDGQRILVFANTETEIDSRLYSTTGAEGIGLLRTEFLHLPNSGQHSAEFLPSEDNLRTYFQTVSEISAGRWVTIRLLDCGGDKPFPTRYNTNAISNHNSLQGVFGLRGVRFLLAEESILHSQLKSLIRANILGNIRVLIPFVTDVSEVRELKKRLRVIWDKLPTSEKSLTHLPAVGAMIETPAAVQMLDFFMGECDFVSIGSNDLTQHLLCMERDKPETAGQFSLFHPALLRSLKMIFEHQKHSEIAISLCGEIASEPSALELLLGLGCRQLSSRPAAIPFLKEIIRSVNLCEAKEFADSILRLDSATEIEQYLRLRFDEKHGKEYFIQKTTHRAS